VSPERRYIGDAPAKEKRVREKNKTGGLGANCGGMNRGKTFGREVRFLKKAPSLVKGNLPKRESQKFQLNSQFLFDGWKKDSCEDQNKQDCKGLTYVLTHLEGEGGLNPSVVPG